MRREEENGVGGVQGRSKYLKEEGVCFREKNIVSQ
jgi:hypothetical protein